MKNLTNSYKINEKVVSFEVAVLAKKLGFDRITPCTEDNRNTRYNNTLYFNYYDEVKNLDTTETNSLIFTRIYRSYISNDSIEYYEAPTQSLLQKWLREQYNFNIWVESVYKKDKLMYSYHFIYVVPYHSCKSLKWYDTYEEALESCLLYALELLTLVDGL